MTSVGGVGSGGGTQQIEQAVQAQEIAAPPPPAAEDSTLLAAAGAAATPTFAHQAAIGDSNFAASMVQGAVLSSPTYDSQKNWDELSKTEQKQHDRLGWNLDNWDNGPPPPSSQTPWSDLSPTQRAAATELGHDAKTWDADPAWDELTPGEQKHWDKLGWDAGKWENGPAPASASKPWGELSADEQEAARGVGFDQRAWDTDGAHELLAEGDRLTKAGKYDEAEKAYEKLQKAPYSDLDVGSPEGAMSGGEPTTADAEGKIFRDYETGKNKTRMPENKLREDGTVLPPDLRMKAGDVAARRQDQAKQVEQMSKTHGRTADPHNVNDAKEYFQRRANGEPPPPPKAGPQLSTDNLRQEYDTYLKNFYTHAGEGGVKWGTEPNDRPGHMNEMLAGQPRDAAGRTLIDCEGYGAMTHAIFGDMKDKSGNKRFEILHSATGSGNHVIAGVFDRNAPPGNDQSFYVNNDRTIPFRPEDKDQAGTYLPGTPTGRNLLLTKGYNGDEKRAGRIQTSLDEMSRGNTGPNPSDARRKLKGDK